jgi:hypothetical protein
MAWIALAGLLMNAIWRMPLADPVAALLLIPIILREGWEAIKGHACQRWLMPFVIARCQFRFSADGILDKCRGGSSATSGNSRYRWACDIDFTHSIGSPCTLPMD